MYIYIYVYIYIYIYVYIYIPNLCEILAEVPWSPSMVKSGTLLNGLSGSRIEIDGCGSQMHRAQKLLLVLPGNHPWWPWWLLRNRWCNLVSDQRALASSRPMGLRWGAATDINGRQPVTMAQVKLIQRSLPYNAQMSVQVSTVDAFQGRMAQKLVRYQKGGLPHFTAKIPGKMQENDDQLWSTTFNYQIWGTWFWYAIVMLRDSTIQFCECTIFTSKESLNPTKWWHVSTRFSSATCGMIIPNHVFQMFHHFFTQVAKNERRHPWSTCHIHTIHQIAGSINHHGDPLRKAMISMVSSHRRKNPCDFPYG